MSETNRAKEFQKGTAGVPGSAKQSATGLAEGSDIGLGPSGREFESPISDQQRNLFLIYIKDRFLSALFFVFTRNSKSRGLYQVLLPVHKFKSTYPWLLHDAL